MRGLGAYFSRWQNVLGLLLVLFYVGVAVAAPRLAPTEDPQAPADFRLVGKSRDRVPHPPSPGLPLGTTPGQFDVFYTVVWGTRSALSFGLSVALGTALFGVLLGAVSAYAGGWIDQILMRLTDAFLAFPLIAGVVAFQLLLSLTVPSTVSLAGLPEGIAAQVAEEAAQRTALGLSWYNSLPLLLEKIGPLRAAFILFSWMPYARLTHTQVTRLLGTDFIQASTALGAGAGRLIFRHLIPNAISPALVLAARDVGGMVILQSTFTFLGLGSGSPWGALLAQNRNWIIGPGGSLFTTWWLFLPVTLMVVLFGVAWNLVGDGINEALNRQISA